MPRKTHKKQSRNTTSWKMTTPTLCLNMIVKNESKIITRLLESVFPLIDTYCICDTGSTDNTVEIIETFFRNRSIQGKIVREPFRDFGYNRSFALKQCEGLPNADFVLLLDADMILRITQKIPLKEIKKLLLEGDAFFLFQGTESFYYKNVRIVRNNRDVKYWGVTHEYVKSPEGFVYQVISREDLFIIDIGDGGSKVDKFARDIVLLKKGLEELPENDRYLFYLANSYKDTQQYDLAIETYKRRIAVGGWHEEIWYSNYNIGNCYKNQNKWEQAIYYYLEAFQHYPKRIENLYEIVHYYRENTKYHLAYQFYVMAVNSRNKIENYDFLFLKKDVYDYKIDYEFTVIGYHVGISKPIMSKACMKVLAYPYLEEHLFRNVMMNYKFYSVELKPEAFETYNYNGLKNIAQQQQQPTDFVSSTPSLAIRAGEGDLLVNVRFVNYKIGDSGNYVNQEKIETRNILASFDISGKKWKKKWEKWVEHDPIHDGEYVGLEDIRLHTHGGKTFFNANRGIHGNKAKRMVVEHGMIDLNSNSVIKAAGKHLEVEKQGVVEKNWVLFTDGKGVLKTVYKWHPLTIGNIVDEKLTDLETISGSSSWTSKLSSDSSCSTFF
jgi:tetratricopeptide (TPR) repeat protein